MALTCDDRNNKNKNKSRRITDDGHVSWILVSGTLSFFVKKVGNIFGITAIQIAN
jgi:hypothetical protein